MQWNDRRTPPGQLTDVNTAAPVKTPWGTGSSPIPQPSKRGFASAHESMKRTAAASASTTSAPKTSRMRKLAGKLGR